MLDAGSDEALLVVRGEEGDDAHGSGDSRLANGVRVAMRMRSRAGLHDSDLHPTVAGGDPSRISFTQPTRVVGVLVDGAAPQQPVRARAPDGTVFELPHEPLTELGGVRLPRATLLVSELEVPAPRAEQIEIHADYEVQALHDFAHAYHLDSQALALGRESFDQFHGYRILGADPAAPRASIEAVAISRPAGRFGNHLMQLVHATHAALELGVDRVYVPAIPWFDAGAPETTAGGVTYVVYSGLDDVKAPALFGTFLFEDLEPAVAVLDGELRQQLVDRHVSSLFAPPPLAEPRPPNHVAVHLRSGDLFDRPDPHPNFVQPPLAYYTTALRHFAAARAGAHVTLVYEDEGNPVIGALHAFLGDAGLPHTIASASLASDLATLLEHRALVLGRGSFGVAVAALSENVETLYAPWSEPRFRGLVRERGLEAYGVEEISPQYIAEGTWRNSPEQRRRMVEYPLENLELTKFQQKERGPSRGLSR